jgi:hypothetical protein
MIQYVAANVLFNALIDLGAKYLLRYEYQRADQHPHVIGDPWVLGQMQCTAGSCIAGQRQLQGAQWSRSIDWRRLMAAGELRFLTQIIVPTPGGFILAAFERWAGHELAEQVESIVSSYHQPMYNGWSRVDLAPLGWPINLLSGQ